MKRCLFLVSFFVFAFASFSQDKTLYEKHWYVSGADTVPYRVLLPKNFDVSKKYPLILFLHGSGERGRDNEAQLIHGGDLFLRDSIRENYPAIIVFPQCPQSSFWSNVDIRYDSAAQKRLWNFPTEGEPTVAMRLLLQLVAQLQKDYKLDKARLYVGGLSMGGMGTFELVRRIPKTFAAAFPICGGAAPATAKKLSNVHHWWIFHGLADPVVPVELSKNMADALVNAGAVIRLSLYPGVGHNSWDNAFAEKDLLAWLFSNHK